MANGEFDLIARLVERLPAPGERVRIGSGDDAAVVEPGGAATATTVDAVVEGVHFTLPEFPLVAVGRKALAAALSDLAAMGAEPGEAYVVLALPERLGADGALEIAAGLAEVAAREGVTIAGGDLSRSAALTLAVTAVGYEPEGARLVPRGGARPGDLVVVTGELGGASAGLRLLGGAEAGGVDAATVAALRERQLDPRPRFAAGLALASAGARSMIDLSDGLGGDAGHLAAAGGVGLELELERVPVQAGVVEVAGGPEPGLLLAAEGGEDFELLACIPEDALAAATEAVEATEGRLSAIGRVLEGAGVTLLAADGSSVQPRGFDHLAGPG